jgi:predicted nucleic acid-binding protein
MSAADSFFVDTNVLLYSFSAKEPVKHRAATQWVASMWDGGVGRLSWQVIFEFYANAAKVGTTPTTARQAVEKLLQWHPEPPAHATIQRAWHWCDTAQTNFWDALIVAAAEQAGCRWLLSEDFQSGRRFGGLTVVNPFERGPAEFGLA